VTLGLSQPPIVMHRCSLGVRGKGDLTGMARMAEVARRTRSAIGSGPMKGENGAVALQEPARG
jgi:hypothetical protein